LNLAFIFKTKIVLVIAFLPVMRADSNRIQSFVYEAHVMASFLKSMGAIVMDPLRGHRPPLRDLNVVNICNKRVNVVASSSNEKKRNSVSDESFGSLAWAMLPSLCNTVPTRSTQGRRYFNKAK
jgi:hypothetical protein